MREILLYFYSLYFHLEYKEDEEVLQKLIQG